MDLDAIFQRAAIAVQSEIIASESESTGADDGKTALSDVVEALTNRTTAVCVYRFTVSSGT